MLLLLPAQCKLRQPPLFNTQASTTYLDAEEDHVCVWQHHIPVLVLGALAGGI